MASIMEENNATVPQLGQLKILTAAKNLAIQYVWHALQARAIQGPSCKGYQANAMASYDNSLVSQLSSYHHQHIMHLEQLDYLGYHLKGHCVTTPTFSNPSLSVKSREDDET